MRHRLRGKKILLEFSLLIFLLATVGLPCVLARLVTSEGTRPQELALTSLPSSYDIDVESVCFDAVDGLNFRGWCLGGVDANLCVPWRRGEWG